jgi:hypothetical protein
VIPKKIEIAESSAMLNMPTALRTAWRAYFEAAAAAVPA